MEKSSLKIMIERFFNAELSIEEERELCSFLREHDVPAELRKDKEAIIALCCEDVEAELPAGAEARLEAMLDTLAENEERCIADEHSIQKAKRGILKVSRLVWHGAAAAVVLVACYLFVNNDGLLPLQRTAQVVSNSEVAAVPAASFEYEEDSFDNPEDAMKCFKAAMGDVRLTLNTTEKNTREIGNTLNEVLQPYKDIIRINM